MGYGVTLVRDLRPSGDGWLWNLLLIVESTINGERDCSTLSLKTGSPFPRPTGKPPIPLPSPRTVD